MQPINGNPCRRGAHARTCTQACVHMHARTHAHTRRTLPKQACARIHLPTFHVHQGYVQSGDASTCLCLPEKGPSPVSPQNCICPEGHQPVTGNPLPGEKLVVGKVAKAPATAGQPSGDSGGSMGATGALTFVPVSPASTDPKLPNVTTHLNGSAAAQVFGAAAAKAENKAVKQARKAADQVFGAARGRRRLMAAAAQLLGWGRDGADAWRRSVAPANQPLDWGPKDVGVGVRSVASGVQQMKWVREGMAAGHRHLSSAEEEIPAYFDSGGAGGPGPVATLKPAPAPVKEEIPAYFDSGGAGGPGPVAAATSAAASGEEGICYCRPAATPQCVCKEGWTPIYDDVKYFYKRNKVS